MSGGVPPKEGSKLPPSASGGGVALPFSAGEGVNTAGSGIAGDVANGDRVEAGAGAGAGTGAGGSVALAPVQCSTKDCHVTRQQQSGRFLMLKAFSPDIIQCGQQE